MQTITSYYYDNTIEVQLDVSAVGLDINTNQRNRVVYTRTIQMYKNINNVLKFQFLNSEQKPINLGDRPATFNIVDDYVFANANVVLSSNITIYNSSQGLGYTIISGNDLVQLDRENYTYNVKINSIYGNVVTYVDDNYNAVGQIFLSNSAYPIDPPVSLDLGQISDPTISAIYDFGNI
jgi:hypothetical protein